MKYALGYLSLSLFVVATVTVGAADHAVAPLAEPPPSGSLSKDVAGQLAPTGFRVTRGGSTTLCDLWLCQKVEVNADFKATGELLYPFTPGQLIGVARFARKGADFRDQDIAPGVYTLRYAQQPVDGAHVGTSPTRDFLLLSVAGKDSSAAVVEYKSLTKQSAEAAGSSHPALLCLQPAAPDNQEFPSIRHNEDHDWWIITMKIATQAGGQAKPLPLSIIVAGKAAE